MRKNNKQEQISETSLEISVIELFSWVFFKKV